jgi:hypothetical protein
MTLNDRGRTGNGVAARPARTLARDAIAVVLAALLPGLAHADSVSPPTVPGDIAVPAGHVPFLLGHAKGTQNYTCQFTGGTYAWKFVAPSATLFGDNGKQIATHYAGPTWKATNGSTVVGKLDASVPAPDPKTAIPWLRLTATPTTPEDGGRLTGTTYIQRVNTAGGVAPTTPVCDATTLWHGQ